VSGSLRFIGERPGELPDLAGERPQNGRVAGIDPYKATQLTALLPAGTSPEKNH
jgi:hypothetical protein